MMDVAYAVTKHLPLSEQQRDWVLTRRTGGRWVYSIVARNPDISDATLSRKIQAEHACYLARRAAAESHPHFGKSERKSENHWLSMVDYHMSHGYSESEAEEMASGL